MTVPRGGRHRSPGRPPSNGATIPTLDRGTKMGRRILLIQGHPDATVPHLCRALEDAYASAATAAGHDVRRVDVARLDFPLLRSAEHWEHGELPASLADAQAAIEWCEHLVLVFPLWLGDMPALLKGFLEQVARPGFAFGRGTANPFGAKRLTGRSARVVVTMGMPALVYRWLYRAHSVRSLERNILGFVGFAPVRETLLGGVGALDAAKVDALCAKMAALGRDAD
jgi:putative NADPH-quinone reductase